MTTTSSGGQPEFDRYAAEYRALLRDPIRDHFARDAGFFHERRWGVLCDFFRRYSFATGRASWLDVGCGKQELLRLGRRSFDAVAGCDPSAEMLRDSTDLDIRLQKDPVILPFDDACFNLVTAACVYHHVEPRERHALTAEIHRVLKPGGVFCMLEHNPLNPVTRIIVNRSPIDADAKLLTARTARDVMRRAGLRPLTTTYFLYLPEGLYARACRLENLLKHVPAGGQYAVFGVKGDVD